MQMNRWCCLMSMRQRLSIVEHQNYYTHANHVAPYANEIETYNFLSLESTT